MVVAAVVVDGVAVAAAAGVGGGLGNHVKHPRVGFQSIKSVS